jgi:hypothetical protein
VEIRRSLGEGAIIDLGEIGADEYPAPASPRRRDGRRRSLAAGLVFVCLLGLAGGGPRRPLLAQLWSRPASLAGFTLGPQVVTLSDPGASALVGLDVFTGERRWRLDVDSPPEFTTDTADTAAAVVSLAPDASGDFALTTTLVNPAGLILARLPGYQTDSVTSGSLLVIAAGPPVLSAGCADGLEPCTDVSALDPGTGRQVWRQAVPGNLVPTVRPGTGSVPGPGAAFATVRHDGTVDVRDATTGAVLGQRPTPPGAGIVVYADILLTATRGTYGAEVAAYHMTSNGSAEAAWSVTVPVSDIVTDATARFYLAACAGFLCLHSDGASTLIEPDTGRIHGQVGVEIVDSVAGTLLAVPSLELSRREREVYLLAADTQRTATLTHSAVIRWRDNGGRALVSDQGAQRTAFTIWSAAGPRRVGSVTGVDLTCQARAAVLVCTDPGGNLRAWRIPV